MAECLTAAASQQWPGKSRTFAGLLAIRGLDCRHFRDEYHHRLFHRAGYGVFPGPQYTHPQEHQRFLRLDHPQYADPGPGLVHLFRHAKTLWHPFIS